jgi:hypothetical protein
VDQDVAENQLRIQQMQDLLDQGTEDRVVFVFNIAQGADLRRQVWFHLLWVVSEVKDAPPNYKTSKPFRQIKVAL